MGLSQAGSFWVSLQFHWACAHCSRRLACPLRVQLEAANDGCMRLLHSCLFSYVFLVHWPGPVLTASECKLNHQVQLWSQLTFSLIALDSVYTIDLLNFPCARFKVCLFSLVSCTVYKAWRLCWLSIRQLRENCFLLTLSWRRQRQERGTDNQPKHPWLSLCPTSLVLYFQG